MRPLLAALVICLAPIVALAQTETIQPAKAERTTETRTLPLKSGSTLSVQNVNGAVTVEAWDREEIEFRGEFKPSSRDEHVKVVLDRTAKGLEIVFGRINIDEQLLFLTSQRQGGRRRHSEPGRGPAPLLEREADGVPAGNRGFQRPTP